MTAYLIGRRLWPHVALVLLLAAAMTLGAYRLAAPQARAAGTAVRISFALTVANKAGQTFTMQHLSKVAVQLNQGAVDNTMDAKQITAATTALGADPAAGITITKSFDNVDRANFVIGLVGKTLASATLFIYCNGALCDKLREAPAYVAYATQSAAPTGSTGAPTETVEFVGTDVKRTVRVASLPVFAPPTTTGITSTLGFANGTHQALTNVQGASVDSNHNKIFGGNSHAQTAVQSAPALKNTNVGALEFTKNWADTNNTNWDSLSALAGLNKVSVGPMQGLGWWVGTFDQQTKAWFEITYPLGGSVLSASVTPQESAEIFFANPELTLTQLQPVFPGP